MAPDAADRHPLELVPRDQAMCSLMNFLLSAYIAHTLGATQFGAFALAYLTYGFANNVSRGVSIEPLLVRFSGVEWKWRRATGRADGHRVARGLGQPRSLALIARVLIGGTTPSPAKKLGYTRRTSGQVV